jgi:hypothetical protein
MRTGPVARPADAGCPTITFSPTSRCPRACARRSHREPRRPRTARRRLNGCLPPLDAQRRGGDDHAQRDREPRRHQLTEDTDLAAHRRPISDPGLRQPDHHCACVCSSLQAYGLARGLRRPDFADRDAGVSRGGVERGGERLARSRISTLNCLARSPGP